MRWRVELSTEAEKQLSQFPREAQRRLARAIDEFESNDDSHWSNIKALQGEQWKGRFRKRVGPYRIIFRRDSEHGTVEISAILLRSKDTYR